MSGWGGIANRLREIAQFGKVEAQEMDDETEVTATDYLYDILGVLESIESHMENIGNAIEKGNQEAAEFYHEFFKRLTASK